MKGLEAVTLEADFQDAVVETAQSYGWAVSHVGPARTKDGWSTPVRYDGKGFPDCVFIHMKHRVLLGVEFKSMTGTMSDEQLIWADRFEAVEIAATPHVKYFMWTPNMMKQIVGYLADPLDHNRKTDTCDKQ